MAVVGDCGFELVDHPTYSHDLDPSGYHLVLKQEKKHLMGMLTSILVIMTSYLRFMTF